LGWGEQLGADFSQEVKPGPLEVGFDEFFGVPYSHNSSPALQVFMRDRRVVGLEPGMNHRSKEAMAKTRRELEDTAIQLSKEAVSFVDRHKDQPFFLYYPTTNIHFPLTPHSRFAGKTRAGVYGEFVVEFDWAVGQLMDALERNGLSDNTIVVLTSDNGARPHDDLNGHACNGPWRETKRTIHEAGHRVPLIVKWPCKIKAGARSDETVCLTDFFVTFASILGLEIPDDAGEDSVDITPVFFGEEYSSPLREAFVHHSVSGLFAIRMGDWKLIEGSGDGDYPKNPEGRIDVKNWQPVKDPSTGEWIKLDYFEITPDDQHQLYNLKEDPKETTNLAKQHPDRVQRMLDMLHRIRES